MANKNQNTVEKRGVGRPVAVLKLPRGNKFTIRQLREFNGFTSITVYKAVKRAVADKTLTAAKEKTASGKAGRPATVYWRTSVFNANKALNSKNKAKKQQKEIAVDVTTPAAPVESEAVIA